MSITLAEALFSLEGRSLSSVEFVQDYLQLRFDGPYLTVYTPPVIYSHVGIVEVDSLDYRNRLCAQIGRFVKVCHADEDAVSITFDNGVKIAISLRNEHYLGPEALEFQSESGQVWVI